MLGIDCHVLSGFSLGEPCQLHDRAASRVEDDPFDVLGVSLDAVALAGQDGYLRCAGRGCNGRSPELIGFMAAAAVPAASSVASGSEAEVVCPRSERMRRYRHAAGVWSLSAGATVKRAGGVAAREVLRADAANLPPTTCDRAGQGR
jgi:hypothetical protein